MEYNLPVTDWREAASRRLPRFVFDYIEGGADEERTLSRNRAALDRMLLLPRCLQSVPSCDIGTVLFGVRAAAPLIVAPTGLNGLLWREGDVALARAAEQAGIPFVLSTASTSPIGHVGRATAGDKWFQLYVMEDRSIAERMLCDAQQAGFRVLMLTVDVPVSGNRLRDQRNAFRFPFRFTLRTALDALSRPYWLRQMLAHGFPSFVNLQGESASPASATALALASRSMARTVSWSTLDWLRERWRGPIVLKGILNPADAARARDCGVDGIVVSNHGGRQLDVVPASIDVLPQIVDRIGGKITVLIDSGFRSGGDVVKALALGANAVLLGRAVLYGLGAAGVHGAASVLNSVKLEIERTLTLAGIAHIGALTREVVVREEPCCAARARSDLSTQSMDDSYERLPLRRGR